MDVEKIINNLNQHKSEIIEILSMENWQHFRNYFKIREKFLKNTLDEEFKRTFCRFYIINGPAGLNNKQKEKFFKLLSLKETNLEKILKALYEISGYGTRKKLFISFGTKLLHTVNEKLPIYDKNISSVLELSTPVYVGSLEERIKNRLDIYEELMQDFKTLLVNDKIIEYLKNIRKELQSKSKLDQFRCISDAKLLDSLLWAFYSILKLQNTSKQADNVK